MDLNRSAQDPMARRSMRGEVCGYRDSARPQQRMELPRSTGTGRMEHGRGVREVPRTDIYARPTTFRAGVRDAVWNNAKDAHGRVRDPVTGRYMSKDKPWDMGHKPGMEFRKHQQDARARGISREQFVEEYNDASHYRPELPSSNRSHRGEDKTDLYLL